MSFLTLNDGLNTNDKLFGYFCAIVSNDSNKNIAANVEIPQLLRVDNLSVIEIVVQIQIRLGNSARTVALRRATAKLQIVSY